jgi:hypothetical protein
MKATTMPKTCCYACGSDVDWTWEEAFDKFGFSDGDATIMTEDVADVLRTAGYDVNVEPWGLHNVVIGSIRKGAIEQIPFDRIRFGYDDARTYLPAEIIRLLDAKLPANGEAAS